MGGRALYSLPWLPLEPRPIVTSGQWRELDRASRERRVDRICLCPAPNIWVHRAGKRVAAYPTVERARCDGERCERGRRDGVFGDLCAVCRPSPRRTSPWRTARRRPRPAARPNRSLRRYYGRTQARTVDGDVQARPPDGGARADPRQREARSRAGGDEHVAPAHGASGQLRVEVCRQPKERNTNELLLDIDSERGDRLGACWSSSIPQVSGSTAALAPPAEAGVCQCSCGARLSAGAAGASGLSWSLGLAGQETVAVDDRGG